MLGVPFAASAIWPALIGGGFSLGGSLFSGSQAAKSTRKAQQLANFAAQNRHLWEVKDLRRAGLNPILSANSGAPIPSFPVAQIPDYSKVGSAVTEGLYAAKELSLANVQLDLLRHQAASAKSQAVVDAIAAERERRSFEAIDNSPAGKKIMPMGNKLPSWIKAAATLMSGISGMPSGGSSAKDAASRISPLQNVFDPNTAKQIWPIPKSSSKPKNIRDAADRAFDIYYNRK
nr:MAG: DNA pilot protein [Microvirus sp.]